MFDFKDFDALPDSALVPVTAFRPLAGIAPSTAWRRARIDPNFPKPIRLGGGKCTRFRVGEIRAFLAGNSPALVAPAEPKTTNRARLAKGRHV